MFFVFYHSYYDYEKFLYENAETSTDIVHVFGSMIQTNNFVLKLLYKIHHASIINKHIQLPFKKIWNKSLIPKGLKCDEVCFVFSSSRVAGIDVSFFDYLHLHYKCKLALLLSNPIDWDIAKSNYDFDKLSDKMDLVCTYNKNDAKKYSVKVYPYQMFRLKGINIIPMEKRTVDVLFVGQDKGRMPFIQDLYNMLTSKGLVCDFYVINSQGQSKISGIHTCNWISYDRLIEMTENAKCIVNIMQPGAKGVTIRDIEAYNYGCFMITNNESEELNDIYNDDQLIDVNNVDDQAVSIIKSRKIAFQRRDNRNSLDYFCHWMEKELSN